MVDKHSRIDAAANNVKPEGGSVPGKGCCSGKVAEEEKPVIGTSTSLESSPPLKPQPPPPTMSSKHADEEHSESGMRTCSGTVPSWTESG